MSQIYTTPDFSNEAWCPHDHELLWSNGWGVSAVVAGIMKCPHNSSKVSPWCIHGSYHWLDSASVDHYFLKLAVPQWIIDEYNVSMFLAGLLDTTRRAPVKGSVGSWEVGFDISSENNSILNLEYVISLQNVPVEEEILVRSLLNQTRKMLTGIPADKEKTENFLQRFWEPVRIRNALRQVRVRFAVQSLENEKRARSMAA